MNHEDEYDEEDEFEEEDDYDDNELDPVNRVGRKLLKLGKIPYKHIEPLPKWLVQRKTEITINRTTHQIRKSLQDWMIKPDRDANQKYRKKRLYWRENEKDDKGGNSTQQDVHAYGPSETIAYTHYFFPSRYSVQRRIFREIKSLMGPNYKPKKMLDFGCGPGTGGAVALDVWGTPAEQPIVPDYRKPRPGPGEFSRSRSMHLDQDQIHDEPTYLSPILEFEYTGVDQSQSMLDAAQVILNSNSTNTNTDKNNKSKHNINLYNRISDVVKRAHNTGERYSLINVSYVLSELANDSMRRAATLLLFELLEPNGILVISEPGSPVGSHTCRTARQLLLDTFGKETLENSIAANNLVIDNDNNLSKRKQQKLIHETDKFSKRMLDAPIGYVHSDLYSTIVAPCTHDKPCPLAQGVWCSFSQRIHSPIVRKAGEEKFSYIVIQRAKVNKTNTNNTNTNDISTWTCDEDNEIENKNHPSPLQVLRDASKTARGKEPESVKDVDWDIYEPTLKRKEWSRIIRTPLKRKGHILIDTCQSNGNVGRSTLTRSTIPNIPSLYSALRKTNWGGLYPALSSGEGMVHNRKSSFAISEEDRRSPLPEHEQKHQKSTTSRSGNLDTALFTIHDGDNEDEQIIEIPATPTQSLGRRSMRAKRGAAIQRMSQRRNQLKDED